MKTKPSHREKVEQYRRDTTPEVRALAYQQPWFVAENGSQIDIHARIFPPHEQAREITVAFNLTLENANEIVTKHNQSLGRAE